MSKRFDVLTTIFNLSNRKHDIEAKLACLSDCPARQELLADAEQLEIALATEGWLRSSELRPPR